MGLRDDRRRRFEALYRREVRAILAYALRRVAAPEDAADVVAATMLVAWRRLDDVPPGDEARLWLFGVARGTLANHRRGERRRDRLGARLRQDVRDELEAPDQLAAVETSVVVRQALERLSAEDREVLQLAAWEELEPSALAVVLGIPASTARTRLHRARARLRQRLERDGGAGHVHHDERVLVRDTEEE